MLEVKHLVKKFGEMTAVKDISFSVEKGQILGLIGQNGAGKTTTFRLILNFLTADAGDILWDGKPFSQMNTDIIGYLPEERGLFLKMTVEEQLYYFAGLKGKSRKDIAPKIDEWLERFQVKGNRKDKIKTLSKGNQQKIQVIATLIHEPKFVILDEPFSGLDPVNAQLLKDGILALKEQGACVIFSSHNMENVAELCDSLIMLRHGEIVLSGDVQTVRESFGRTRVYVESNHTLAELQTLPGVKSIQPARHAGYDIILNTETDGKAVYDYVTKNGYVYAFSQQPPTLDEIFKLKAEGRHE